jgi:uncharacterized secreted protein with C-terminal beta-propeller domain
MTSRLPFSLGALGGTLVTTLLVCHPAQSDTAHPVVAAAQPPALALTTSHTCEAVRDVMIDTVVHQLISPYGGYYGGYYPYGGGAMPADEDVPMAKSAAPAAAPSAAPQPMAQPMPVAQGPSHYTTTNVHEAGVDEADIVKTDGKFVYTLHNNALVIAKTWPVAKTDVASRFTFKTLQAQQMYLHGDQLIVSGYGADGNTDWPEGHTRVVVLDVSNRSRPSIDRIVDVGGWSSSSRVIGDQLYLVQASAAQIPPKLYETAQKAMASVPRTDMQSLRPWEIQGRMAAMLRTKLVGSVSQADITSALPKVRIGNKLQRMSCDDLYVPRDSTQLGVTTLARISLSSDRTDMVGALVSGGQVYASTAALYIAAPLYAWNNWGVADYATQVHQFSLGDAQTRPAYIASGKVPGNVLNEFSLSEWNGDLRIATTTWNWSGQQQEQKNDLFVLRPFGHELRSIGSIRGFAKGERIYAGRMIGDKGYLVTFKQTDPLFTLDLSDPTNPRIAGELKINGFSSYIHPLGDDQLLTIGQDADDAGRVKGLHLQVFDVKDPAHPRRTFHTKVAAPESYSWSSAQGDHHAFMYDPVTGTIAFPFSQYSNAAFNGLAVYHLDRKTGFRSLGRIDHGVLADALTASQCARFKRDQPQSAEYYCKPEYLAQMRYGYGIDRSMVIDKYILSISTAGLEVHELADLDFTAALSWEKVEQSPEIAQ